MSLADWPRAEVGPMAKSKRLRLRDLRDAYRIIGECRDLGDEVRAWRGHMLQGLRQLVDAQIALAGEVRGGGSWSEALHEPMDLGCESDEVRAALTRYEQEIETESDLAFGPLLDLAMPLVTRIRGQMLEDRDWYASATFNEHRRRGGVDDWLCSLHRLDDPPAIHTIVLHRPLGAPRFTPRERRLAHLFHHELARLMGPVLLREPDRIVSGLPPRLRQVLDLLLEGEGEKQVATRLGISRSTVHEYVVNLYRRFDVSSRAELLAHCLRRRVR